MCGDTVNLNFAKSMTKLYRPPKIGKVGFNKAKSKNNIVPSHSNIWLVSLISGSWDDIDCLQEDAGWFEAERVDDARLIRSSFSARFLLFHLRFRFSSARRYQRCFATPGPSFALALATIFADQAACPSQGEHDAAEKKVIWINPYL
jgi:hypothetical protein